MWTTAHSVCAAFGTIQEPIWQLISPAAEVDARRLTQILMMMSARLAMKVDAPPKKTETADREAKPKDESFRHSLGAHMSIAGGPSKALERGRSIGCTAIQIFVKNNMQWFAKPFAETELAAYHKLPGSTESGLRAHELPDQSRGEEPGISGKIDPRAQRGTRAGRINSVSPFLCCIQERTWETARKPV